MRLRESSKTSTAVRKDIGALSGEFTNQPKFNLLLLLSQHFYLNPRLEPFPRNSGRVSSLSVNSKKISIDICRARSLTLLTHPRPLPFSHRYRNTMITDVIVEGTRAIKAQIRVRKQVPTLVQNHQKVGRSFSEVVEQPSGGVWFKGSLTVFARVANWKAGAIVWEISAEFSPSSSRSDRSMIACALRRIQLAKAWTVLQRKLLGSMKMRRNKTFIYSDFSRKKSRCVNSIQLLRRAPAPSTKVCRTEMSIKFESASWAFSQLSQSVNGFKSHKLFRYFCALTSSRRKLWINITTNYDRSRHVIRSTFERNGSEFSDTLMLWKSEPLRASIGGASPVNMKADMSSEGCIGSKFSWPWLSSVNEMRLESSSKNM